MISYKFYLREAQWKRIEDLLPGRVGTRGPRARDNRQFLRQCCSFEKPDLYYSAMVISPVVANGSLNSLLTRPKTDGSMSNPPFIAPAPPVTPVAREYKVTPEAQQRALDARRSALEAARAALVDVDGSRASELLELEGLIRFGSTRRAKQRMDGSEEAVEYASAQLKQLTDRLGEADRAVLKTLAAHFPDLGAEADPLARLMSARLAPGPATLLLAAAQAGADEVRLRRLKEALARLLKQAYGEVHFSLFSCLTFGNDPQQCNEMKRLYHTMVNEGGTMSALFKSLMRLPDREMRLRMLLCAVACELSGADPSVRGARLAAVVNDIRRLLIFLGLNETCQDTAARLMQPDGIGIAAQVDLDSDTVLMELIETSEQAWIDADSLELRFGALGIYHLSAKLRCARAFQEIWNYLPGPFFDDDNDKRQQILTAFKELTIALAEQEEELL